MGQWIFENFFGHLTNNQRGCISFQLLSMMGNGKLPWGKISWVANQIEVHKRTISRIFRGEKQRSREAIDVRSKKGQIREGSIRSL